MHTYTKAHYVHTYDPDQLYSSAADKVPTSIVIALAVTSRT
jgi:hypothetical protein